MNTLRSAVNLLCDSLNTLPPSKVTASSSSIIMLSVLIMYEQPKAVKILGGVD